MLSGQETDIFAQNWENTWARVYEEEANLPFTFYFYPCYYVVEMLDCQISNNRKQSIWYMVFMYKCISSPNQITIVKPLNQVMFFQSSPSFHKPLYLSEIEFLNYLQLHSDHQSWNFGFSRSIFVFPAFFSLFNENAMIFH